MLLLSFFANYADFKLCMILFCDHHKWAITNTHPENRINGLNIWIKCKSQSYQIWFSLHFFNKPLLDGPKKKLSAVLLLLAK